MHRGELIIGFFLIAVSVAAWIGSSGFVAETTMVRTLSPAFYPRLLIAGLAFCALLLLARAWRARSSGAVVLWNEWHNVLFASGVMFFQIFAFEGLGWFASSWISLVLLMRITRVPFWMSLVIPTGFIIFVYLFFVLLLNLQFPRGFLPTLF